MKPLFWAVALALGVTAAWAEPRPGEKAPEIDIAGFVNAPAGAPVTLAEMRDRVVVLEFWATWCGPCIPASAHLDAVARECADEGVIFVSISSEEQQAVEAFLARRGTRVWAAIDRDHKSFDAYGVRVLPHAFVIDREGVIVASTSPEEITAEVLRHVAAGRPIDLPFKSNQAADLEWDRSSAVVPDAPEVLVRAVLERSSAAGGAISMPPGSGRIVGDGLSLASMIPIAYGVDYSDVRNSLPAEYGAGPYRISIKGGNDEAARQLLEMTLHNAFDFEVEWVEELAQVPVVRRLEGAVARNLVPTSEAEQDGFARSGSITGKKVSVEYIVSSIGSYGYGVTSIDETGLEGEFDVSIKWVPGDAQILEQALRDCGLVCVMEERSVRRLRVTPK